jgi:hypothetical protein
LLLFVVLALVLLGLPLVLEAPDLARRLTHPLEYEETIRDAAAEHDIEPALVAAVIRTESGFDPDVESSQGAYGLMQIQPETAGFISERGGIAGDYRGPKTNIRMGTWYLIICRIATKAMRDWCSQRIIRGRGRLTPGSPKGASTCTATFPSRRPTSTSRTCPRHEMFTKSCTGVI